MTVTSREDGGGLRKIIGKDFVTQEMLHIHQIDIRILKCNIYFMSTTNKQLKFVVVATFGYKE